MAGDKHLSSGVGEVPVESSSTFRREGLVALLADTDLHIPELCVAEELRCRGGFFGRRGGAWKSSQLSEAEQDGGESELHVHIRLGKWNQGFFNISGEWVSSMTISGSCP